MDILEKVFRALDKEIEIENQQRREDSALLLTKAEIRLLGQMSLISNPEVQAQITLLATFDVDALVKGGHWIESKFRDLLKKEDLELDSLSHEIWIPSESTFTEVFSSNRLVCLRLDPLYVFLSKAIKAKEKNRMLIAQALEIYGNELRKLIQKYGGDLKYFNLTK